MAYYLATRIMAFALTYELVCTKRPDLQEQINEELRKAGREDLIVLLTEREEEHVETKKPTPGSE